MADSADKFLFGPWTVVTQCVLCKHAASGSFGRACPSFPGGIPDEITTNAFDHRKPHPDECPVEGVAAVRFEPRDGVRAEVLAALYSDLDAL